MVRITSQILDIKRLTVRTTITNGGVHEGPNRIFLELWDQIENNK